MKAAWRASAVWFLRNSSRPSTAEITYAATFVVQSGLILWLSSWLGWNLFWSYIPTIFIVTIMSYLGHKYFTFRTKAEAIADDLDAAPEGPPADAS